MLALVFMTPESILNVQKTKSLRGSERIQIHVTLYVIIKRLLYATLVFLILFSKTLRTPKNILKSVYYLFCIDETISKSKMFAVPLDTFERKVSVC